MTKIETAPRGLLHDADPAYFHRLESEASSLRGAPGRLELPATSQAPTEPRGARSETARLPRELTERLSQIASRLGTELEDLVLTAFVARLGRASGERDLVLGLVTHASESKVEESHVVWSGPLVVRPRLPRDVRTSDAVRAIAEARRHASAENVAFADLVAALELATDGSRLPLVHAIFERGTTVSRESSKPSAVVDLALRVRRGDDGGDVELDLAHDDAIDATFATNTLASIVAALTALGDRLEEPLARLPTLSAWEESLASSFARRDPYDASRPWFVRVAEHARATPDAIGVVARGRELRYAEIDAMANRLANRLVARGVRVEDRVAIHCGRTETMIIAALAVHRAGAAYVPIDPGYPPARIRMILDDAAPMAIVTDPSIADPGATEGTIVIDAEDPSLREESSEPTGIDVDPRSLAYVIFTSGSTGRPKGVAIEHRSVTNLLESMAVAPGLAKTDRMLGITSFSFDVHVPDVMLALFVGASVEVADSAMAVEVERLAEKLRDPAITFLQATPTTYRMLLDHGFAARPDLRASCGGEAITPDLVEGLVPRVGELWNVYGPTETTVWSTVFRFTDAKQRISLGRPLANTSIHLLDALGERVPVGAIGEIHLGGDGVARGYFGREDLTAERFVPDPFAASEGARMYRTGDLARILPDGSIDFLGRSDFQVKVRGHRIELGEIESAILAVPGVSQAVVVAREDVPNDVRVVAYLVSDDGHAVTKAKASILERLPRYMLPSAFVVLEVMPLTPSCKIDRKALPPPSNTSADDDATVVADDVEATVRAIFLDLLRTGAIDLDTSFFDAGGNSLLAVRLARRLEEELGTRIDLARIFQGASVRAVADAVRTHGVELDRPKVVELRRGTTDRAMFCICGVSLYQHLARAMPKDLSVYGIYLPIEGKLFDHVNLRRGHVEYASVRELASMYVDAIRSVRPEGPYRLVGVSFGGVVAYEVAQQLVRAGFEVSLLGLLDPFLPGAYGGSLARRTVRRVREVVTNEVAWTSLAKLVRGRLARSRGGADTSFDDAELAFLRDQTQDFAVHRYARSLPEFDGDAVLIHADDRSLFGSAKVDVGIGWRSAVRGALHQHTVSGDHLGILDPPNVEMLAARLASHLD